MPPLSTRGLERLLRPLDASRPAILSAAADAMRWLRDPGGVVCHLLAAALVESPELRDLLRRDDALGMIAQALSMSKLEASYRATAAQKRKFTREEIPIVTQLFTPRWVIEFLLQNSLGRLWLEMHPASKLRAEWTWLIDPPATRLREPRPASSIRVLDPACGTMNFGLVAIDMLAAMYREERGDGPQGEVADSIVAKNVYGMDIDEPALELAAKTLRMKLPAARAEPKLRRGDFLFDELPREWRDFDVVATNPPYLSARNLPPDLVAGQKARFPHAWRDQYACFIDRAINVLSSGGRAALLTMQSFMFTTAYQRLRQSIFQRCAVESVAHFGPGLFDVGNPGTLQTVAFVLRRETDAARRGTQPIAAIRLVERDDKEQALRQAATTSLRQCDLSASPRAAWCYWLAAQQRKWFATLPRLREVAPPRQGLATTDNARFVRCWWEVTPTSLDPPCRASDDTWFAYAKSGRFRRWHEAPRHRVNWRDDGAAIKSAIVRRYPYLRGKWQWVAKNAAHYFKSGVTYSYLTSGRFSARRLDGGAIFDVAGSSLFPEDPLTMLAILNSSIAQALLAAISPTVNFQVGDLAELPVPRGTSQGLRADVQRAIEITRSLDRFDETAPDFVSPLPWREGRTILDEARADLTRLEDRIDRQVAELYGSDDVPPHQPRRRIFCQRELARRWISFVLQQILRERGSELQLSPLRAPVRDDIRTRLQEATGSTDAVCDAAGGLERFLAREFAGWHSKLYQQRPVVWVFGDKKDRVFAVLHDHATRAAVRSIARRAGGSIDPQWRRCVDDGITINLAPLAEALADRALARSLRRVRDDLANGGCAWSDTARRMTSVISAGR